MKTKLNSPICSNCEYSELFKEDDVAGFYAYSCKRFLYTMFIIDTWNEKIGYFGIWSDRCRYFEQKIEQ
jgi:hypothetical protein